MTNPQSQPQPPAAIAPAIAPAIVPASAEQIALLKAIASANPPNWQFPLKFYSKFKWERIGATIYATDQDGVSAVLWAGHVYTRRIGENKRYGAAIWYSRSAGKDDNGENNYLWLCTFRNGGEVSAEPLPDYVKRELTKQ